VELALSLTRDMGSSVSLGLSALFFAISVVFVWRSFYGMRIRSGQGA
jgi:K(+)-stimulated pyrophosphate-energized sodium pump